MANSVGIRLNDIAEERVLGAMLAAGDENVSTHIKRVYFAALERQDDYTDQISAELEQMQHVLRELQLEANDNAASLDTPSLSTASSAEASTTQQDLLLTLVSGIYRMLRQAVPAPIQRDADKVINIDAIEAYLKPDPHDDNATTIDAIPDSTEQPSGGRRARLPNPYLEGKQQAQAERARRAEESKREIQKTSAEDEALTANQAEVAAPVSQKPSFAQRLKLTILEQKKIEQGLLLNLLQPK